MNVFLLYFGAVAIWGTTWIVISFQLGDVAPEVSLAYRFGLAAILMFGFCKMAKLSLRFSLAQHIRLFGIGLTMFGINFYLLYNAQLHLTSALAAITFATLVVMNIVNARLFLGIRVSGQAWLGAAVGLAGICALFWPQIVTTDIDYQTLSAIGMCLAGTYVASLSNMLSISSQQNKMPVLQSNAWAMGYGAVTMAVLALINGREFVTDLPVNYWLALSYLAVFGSIIAYACYVSLLGKIGAHKTSYISIITPAIAVVISNLFENLELTVSTFSGMLLILLGNVIVLAKKKPIIQKPVDADLSAKAA